VTVTADISAALEHQARTLVDYALDVFLEIDFLDHNVLGGTLTGGHVVTYLAREGDRMADELLESLGEEVPEPDRARRWEIAEGGNERPGAVMVDDIVESTERLRRALTAVDDWTALPSSIRQIPRRRLIQLVTHLVDLGRPWEELQDDDARAAVHALPDVFAEELSGYRLLATDGDEELTWVKEGATTIVTGSPRALLAWATGRAGAQESSVDLPPPALRVWI